MWEGHEELHLWRLIATNLFLEWPRSSSLPGPTPYALWHFALFSLCGQGSFLLGLTTWFIDTLWLLDPSAIKSQSQSPPSFTHSSCVWMSGWSAAQASVDCGGKGKALGLSAMKDSGKKLILQFQCQFSISNRCHSCHYLIFWKQTYFVTTNNWFSSYHLVSRILKFIYYSFQNKNLDLTLNNKFPFFLAGVTLTNSCTLIENIAGPTSLFQLWTDTLWAMWDNYNQLKIVSLTLEKCPAEL